MTEYETQFPEIKQLRRKIFSAKLLLKSFLYAFALLGVLFVIIIFSLIELLKKDTAPIKPIPPKAVLTINFSNIYDETRVDDLVSDMAGIRSVSYYDLINAVYSAANDDRVRMLAADVSEVDLGLAQVQDLRNAVKYFESQGKKTMAFSTGFGSFSGGTKSYYLASAFNEIAMQPDTDFGMTGLSMEVPFFKGLLAKIGVEPEFYTRYEYKNGAASLTNDKLTKEHRQELKKMANSIFDQILADISTDRNIEIAKLRKIIDKAPLTANEAQTEGLIDAQYFRTTFEDADGKSVVKNLPVSIEDYSANLISESKRNANFVAFLVLDGVIEGGLSEARPFKENIIGSLTVLEQLKDIEKDKNIKALVVRINSPGGSYNASNEIWAAINNLKSKRQMPVVVSMSNYAASGGYFVALSGDYVYAESSTITGSIGVLGGKMVLAGLWNKLGVNWESINIGLNSGAFSSARKFSASERKAFNKSLDNVYTDFTSKVAKARGIDLKKLDGIARGRVWTGIEAKELNLIDDIGGIDAAVTKAAALAEIDTIVSVIYYPKKKTMQEKLAEFINGKTSMVQGTEVFESMGVDLEDYKLLQRMEYDAVLPPFKLSM
ncbi:MAG: signal peptide peptidase SppA [Lactobacillaceae bacterium]|jgi:protease-4|nr:signal peptide peptidase SppA [Lactobacillaceae bacterium]